MDGKLSKAQESSAYIYIYDIASASWSVQNTTDKYGGSETVLGSNLQGDPGIPEQRDHMCTVVGEAADKSSYNLYVFGGKNKTYSMGDIWVLSLPR